MSASTKKKLRKEQNAAAMTEKQQREKKEAKKLKNYTLIFVVTIVLVLVMALGLLLQVPLAGMFDRGTTAATVGSHKLSTTEFSYYYIDTIIDNYREAYDSYGSYAQYFVGYDMATPLSDQIYDTKEGTTWADHFIELTLDNIKSTLALYDEAVKNNYEMTEEDQELLDYTIELMDDLATVNQFSSTDAFLRANYGNGATRKSYAEYCNVKTLASSYFTAYSETLEYTNEDYREYEKDKYDTFSSFTFATYTVEVSDYLTGDKDSSGNYSAEQKAAALEAAKKDAEALKGAAYKNISEFNEAAKKLDINKDKTSISFSEYKNTLYTSIYDEDVKKWVSDTARKKGETTSIEITTTTTDADNKETTETTGFTVTYYVSKNENLMNLVDVQHILIKFQGGTTNSSTGEVTYTQAEKNAARDKAYGILNEWKKGEATKESFAELAKKWSEDTGSSANGGLYEDVYPGQMVEAFDNWCFYSNQVPGNTGYIETEYGWHVMYLVEKDERTYRDFMIDNEMLNKDMEEWHEDLQEAYTPETNNMSRINKDLKTGSIPLMYYI